MNTQPLDKFETALLAELREHVATRVAVPVPTRRRRRLVAAGATLATAGAATVGFLVLRPDAAYAVDREADGDVVVTISSLEDAEGLEQALEAEGVEAEVEYDATAVPPVPPEGQRPDQAEPGSGSHLESEGGSDGDLSPLPEDECLTSIMTTVSPDGVVFRLPATAVESDAVLHITTSGDADEWAQVGIRWEGDPC